MTSKQLKTRIATNIRKYIGKNDYTITYLSKETGVGFTGLMRILSGDNAPRPSTMVKLCEVLHCDPVDLFEPTYPEQIKRGCTDD